jgi:hypothetical protein
MKKIFSKTFLGLSKRFLIRQYFFSILIAIIFFQVQKLHDAIHDGLYGMLVGINTLLYPYSRFVYEGLMDFLIGNNEFTISGIIFLFFKLITITLCWIFAIIIAPIGLLFLYYYNSRNYA